MDTFIYPFTHCVFLLAMATPVRKIFTTNVGQMQRRRHHMPLAVFTLSFV